MSRLTHHTVIPATHHAVIPATDHAVIPATDHAVIPAKRESSVVALSTSICLCLLLAACQPADPHTGYTTTDSAGVRIAANDTPTDRLKQIASSTPDGAVTIGVVAGEDAYMFNRISDATRLEDGHIVVADESQQLRVFNSAGKHVVTYGGKGQGPGEFLSISDIVPLRGDTMLVWDQHAMRYSAFSVSGGLIERSATRRKNLSDLLIKDFYYEHMYPVGDGSLVVEVTPRVDAMAKEAQQTVGEYYRPMSTLVWVNQEFSAYRKLGEHGGIEQIKTLVAGKSAYFVPPGGRFPQQSIAGSPARICVDAINGAQVNCYDAEGKATYIRWHSAAIPLPADAFGKWIELEVSRANSGFHGSPEQVRATLTNVPPLKELAPVSNVRVDALGFVWVRSPDFAPDSARHARFRVFDREGQLRGFASIHEVAPREIGSDYTLSVVRNADGVEMVILRPLLRMH